MTSYLNWNNFNTNDLFAVTAIAAIMVLPYLYMIYKDFKYKEMDLWAVLLACLSTLIIPIIVRATGLTVCITLAKYLLIGLPVWVILFVLNGLFNSEKTIGRADVDLLSLQAIVSAAILFWMKDKLDWDKFVIVAFDYLNKLFASAFIGLVLLIVLWSINILWQSRKYKDIDKSKLKQSLKDNRQVPALFAFLPMIIFNIANILAS